MPKGEHNLTLVDDLKWASIVRMKREGFQPALVVETSPANFQAWLKHLEPFSQDVGTAAAHALAVEFGGDKGAADWRHFGRLAGFTSRKRKYCNADGLHPYVRLIESSGASYPEAVRFLADVRRDLAKCSQTENCTEVPDTPAISHSSGRLRDNDKMLSM